MGTYEIVAVLRPDLDEEGLGAAFERIKQRIAEHGGSVKSMDRWGKRKLAYPIQKHRDGYYALFVFTLDPGHISPLRQILGLNEELLRFAFASHHAKPVPAAPAGPAPAAQAATSTAQAATSTAQAATPTAAASAASGAGASEVPAASAETPHV